MPFVARSAPVDALESDARAGLDRAVDLVARVRECPGESPEVGAKLHYRGSVPRGAELDGLPQLAEAVLQVAAIERAAK
jgi:hypothetical protein